MRWRGFAWAATLFAVVIIVVMTAGGWETASTPDTVDLTELTVEELQAEKLKAEIEEIRRVSDESESLADGIINNGPLLTALVGILGALGAWWKHLQQREDQAERAGAERLAKAVVDLGADSESVRASAAVTLGSLFRERSPSLRADAFDIVVANLKVKHTDEVTGLLVGAFERGMRSVRPRAEHTRRLPVRWARRARRKLRVLLRRWHVWQSQDRGLPPIDLKDARLPRVNLSGLDLRNVNLKFADLHGADLTDCDLRGVKGYEVYLEGARLSRSNLHMAQLHSIRARDAQFHDCRMAAVKLKEGDLAGAEFRRASAQTAQFQSADLRGSKFEQADINNAGFRGCTLDSVAMRSLVDAYSWRQARFADEDREALEEISRTRDEVKRKA